MDSDLSPVSEHIEMKVEPILEVLPKSTPRLASDPLELGSDPLAGNLPQNDSLISVKLEPSSPARGSTQFEEPQLDITSESDCRHASSNLDLQESLPLPETLYIKQEFSCEPDESNSELVVNNLSTPSARPVADVFLSVEQSSLPSYGCLRSESESSSSLVVSEDRSTFQQSVSKSSPTPQSVYRPTIFTLALPKEFKCDVCFKVFAKSSYLHKHKRIHLRTPLTCIKCNKVFSTKSDLELHAKSHEHKCDICGKVYANVYFLRDHKRVHTETSPKCFICKKAFSTISTLHTHLRACHIKEKLFPCSFCEKSFSIKSQCKDHMKIHTKEFQCTLCERAFAHKPLLMAHLRMHAGKSDHTCNECGKSYSANVTLQRHKQVHKPPTFSCAICNRDFHLKGILRTHIMNQHLDSKDGGKFPCPTCDVSFNTRWERRKHVKVH